MSHDVYWPMGRLAGIPLRVHRFAPLFLLLITALKPASLLGIPLIVLVHELGHAFVVRRVGASVVGVDFEIWGGACRWSGQISQDRVGLIAWGGVWAQLILLGAVLGLEAVFPAPPGSFARELTWVMVRGNLAIVVLNLAPVPPFDGAEAWALVGRVWRRLVDRRRRTRVQPGAPEPTEEVSPPEVDAAMRDLVARLKAKSNRRE